ncbi:acyl-coenzyme A thioesterase 11 isoform X2 [Carcharodon carcharias]|uniref:acyl-coenzyme A thioesterase 11 isoform X2 n=1 Tax=Carcharodon carcharias TaxID=13397 RepID=UPI001B7ED1A4|nr:acyl-coenzyme A thioesterase 11 isoform X2 [Carcharodon carcharias]
MMADTKELEILEEPLFILENGDVYINLTEVKMSQLVLPCHADHRGDLSVGQLLKWMDTTACLSAERHANCPCVTVSVDDIDFEHTLSIGQVVNIKAKVNRAFNTSVEVGIAITCEDPLSGMQWNVCNAFATFVAKGSGLGKLKPVIPRTSEEQMEYSIAAERRRMRLHHLETIKDLVSSSTIQDEPNFEESQRAVPAGKTRVESIELVLPPHANHQSNTFGGQIMAWMESVATISASRFCKGHPVLKTIDMFHFRGPSQVGDRISLKAIVNNAFKTSFEVGVCAEAYHQEVWDQKTHINSAFLTFVMLDKDGELSTLPRIKPEAGDGERRYREASARKKIRLDRKYIISRKQTEVPLSVPWDPSNQVYLSYNNISALKMLAAKQSWVLNCTQNKAKLFTLEEGQFLSVKVEMSVSVNIKKVFMLLSDMSRRHEWDTHYQKFKLIQKVDEDDVIYHVISPSVSKGSNFQDFVLLASRRVPCTDGDPYLIALRSVSLPAAPPTKDLVRSEVMCAGFTLWEEDNTHTRITYYIQATPGVLPYITRDITGLSANLYKIIEACNKFLEQNKDMVNVTL